MSRVIALQSLKHHPNNGDISDKVKKAIEYFPEIKNDVYIGMVKKKGINIALVDVDNNLVRFNVGVKITYNMIFHELMHLVQYNSNYPKTEEYCSIYGLARMPPELVDGNDIPYILSNIKNIAKIPQKCRDAIKYRESGHRNYIQFLRGFTRRGNKGEVDKFLEIMRRYGRR